MFHFIVVVVVLAVSSCFSLDMTVHVDVVVVVVVLGAAWFHEIKLFFRSRKEFFFLIGG